MKFTIYNLQFSINFKFSNFQKLLKISLLNTLFLFLFTNLSSVNAQVVINELSPVSSQEWVELYNLGQDMVSLKGYIIYFDDNPSTTQKKIFCDGDLVNSNSYKLILSPGGGSSWLANTGDTVILKKEGLIIDTISYGEGQAVGVPSATQSITRQPDGSSNWVISDTPSSTGETVSFDCPTPTPTQGSSPTPPPTAGPTQASTPTKSPTPTKTPTPTKIPTSTKTPTPTKTTLSAGGSEDNPQVLSGREDSELSLASTPQVLSLEINTDSTQASSVSPGKTGGVPATAVLMIAGGIVFLGIGAVSIVRRRKSPYNEIDGEKFG